MFKIIFFCSDLFFVLIFHHHRVVGGHRVRWRKINVAQNSFARSSVGLCLFYFAEALVIFLVGFALSVFSCGVSRVTYNGEGYV